MNLAQAANVLNAYVSADIPAMLWGAPGVGKSDSVAQVADGFRAKAKGRFGFIDQRVTLLDPVDLRGLPYILYGAAVWGAPGFLPNAPRAGRRGRKRCRERECQQL